MKALNKLATPLLVFFGVVLAPTQAYADDIEIYYSNPEGGGAANIVMMLDTSGSMDTRECMDFDSYGNCTRTAKRMDELKSALNNILDSVSSNARIGIGVYNYNDGGRLIYPVSDLDALDASGEVVAYITSEGHDGADEMRGGSMIFDINDSYTTLPGGYTGDGKIGLIFSDVNVPRNATIKSASVRFMAATDYNGGTVNYNYQYEIANSLGENPQTFDDNNGDIGNGHAGRNLSINYQGSVSGNWNRVDKYDVDVTKGVQDALREANWCGNKDLALFFSRDGSSQFRNVYLRDALNANEGETTESAPELIIEWDPNIDPVVGATSGEDEMACQSDLRFGLGSANDDGDARSYRIDLDDSDGYAGTNEKVGLRFPNIPFDLDDSSAVVNDVLHRAILNIKGDETNRDFDLYVSVAYGATEPFDENNPDSIWGLKTTSPVVVPINRRRWDNWHQIDITSIAREAMEFEQAVAGDTPASWRRGKALAVIVQASRNGTPVDMYETGASSAAYLELSVSTPTFKNVVKRVRDTIKELVGGLVASGNTPSMESYSEMARYMLGKRQSYAFVESSDRTGMIPGTDVYDSPMTTDSCGSSNNIVLLTDGYPTQDYDYNRAVESLTGQNRCNRGYGGTYGSYYCQEALASWLYDGTRNGAEVPIKTHTIAFSNDPGIDALMRRVSAAGGGGIHAKARNATDLTNAFEEIINSVTVENGTLAAPGVAVNQLNRFRHLDQLYYALFKPSTNIRWEGNLKRYRVSLESDNPKVVDENNLPAVDPNNGFFLDSADSWWGVSQDGSDATAGGAREELAPGSRKLFVALADMGHGTNDRASSAPGGGVATLFEEFDDVDPARIGLPANASDDDRTNLWTLLMEAWGDPLHSQPVLVNYGFSGTVEQALQDPDRQDNTVFVANNDGMLIAIEPKTGEELFAYMPAEEALKAADRYRNREVSPPNFARGTYGLDGGITMWRRGDGSGGVDHVYAYVAQRRGGNSIFAVNVTDRKNPQPMWSITGGSGDFAKLGQTWSQPALTQVLIDGDKVPALIFGGGYSATDHDNAGVVSGGDVTGNALYIVNAHNGALIWSASNSGADINNPDMDWSVAAKPSIIDYDLDGAVDFIYFSDLGGQIFRVDMNEDAGSGSDVAHRVATVARLGTSESGGIDDHRRFFSEPVISLANAYDRIFFQISIGSGYRPHPLSTDTENRIYVINDTDAVNAMGKPKSLSASFTPSKEVVPGDLLDVTSNLDPDEATLSGKRGWYIDLEKGEKVLAAAEVLDGTLYMTSYLPESKAVDKCTNVIGSSRLYVMGVLDGAPKGDFNNDGTIDGRSKDLQLAGLPPAPQLLVSSGIGGGGNGGGDGDGTGGGADCDGGKVVLVGTQAFRMGCTKNDVVQKTRWFEVPDENAATQYLEENKGLD